MKRNRPVYRLCTVLLAAAMVILSTGCAMPKAEPEQPTPTTPPSQGNASQQTVLFATLAPEPAASGAEPTPEEVQESTPEPTQAPQKTSVTIGAVGDIMVKSQAHMTKPWTEDMISRIVSSAYRQCFAPST